MKGDIFFANLQEFNNKYIEALNLIQQKKLDKGTNMFMDMYGIQNAFLDAVKDFTTNPSKFFQHNLEYASKVTNLMFHFMDKMNGNNHAELYTHNSRDRRFKNKSWQESIYFNFVKQFYFMSAEWYRSLVEKLDLPESEKKLIGFYTEQVLNAASPTNFINLNPEALNELVNTNGKNLIQGIENFLDDIKKSDNFLSITTTSNDIFKLGKNIASTKGKVIFQNELMQLICYEPKETTYKIPIFILPPWINKYYILDLSPENSFIKFLVEEGFQVFLVSWVNPDSTFSHKNFEDYLKEGVIEPINFLKDTFKYENFNVIGYCLGGTLAACAAAYFSKIKQNYFNSLTLFTSMLDFSEPGDLGLFINSNTISAIKEDVENKGYFSGKYMSYTFSLLRANELIWSFVVNNYILGKKPMAFDLLYWNSDSTNLPASMHNFYLENMYIHNNLIKKNHIKLLNEEIDLTTVENPVFFLSAIEDHIAPWESTFQGLKLFSSCKEKPVFCLAGSGHIAGVVNPPKNNKYSYYINNNIDDDASKWLAGATEHNGSWWNYWAEWVKSKSLEKANSLDYNKLNYIEEAPGSYVRKLTPQ